MGNKIFPLLQQPAATLGKSLENYTCILKSQTNQIKLKFLIILLPHEAKNAVRVLQKQFVIRIFVIF